MIDQNKHDGAIIRWLGHAQHFIAASSCQFRLATEVAGESGVYVVSTIGEWVRPELPNGFGDIGFGRKYETYVFPGLREHQECGCPVIDDWTEIDSLGANTAIEATGNHYELIEKWSRIAQAGRREQSK